MKNISWDPAATLQIMNNQPQSSGSEPGRKIVSEEGNPLSRQMLFNYFCHALLSEETLLKLDVNVKSVESVFVSCCCCVKEFKAFCIDLSNLVCPLSLSTSPRSFFHKLSSSSSRLNPRKNALCRLIDCAGSPGPMAELIFCVSGRGGSGREPIGTFFTESAGWGPSHPPGGFTLTFTCFVYHHLNQIL